MNLRERVTVPRSAFISKEIRHASPESRAAWYQEMHKHQPIRYRQEFDLWDVFRYEDVQRVLSEYATFSANLILFEGLSEEATLGTDPPRHTQIRSLMTKAFTPRALAQLAPRITEIVDELLDGVIADGKMDLAEQIAYPLPVRVIAEMLGVPPQDQERFRRWSYQLLGVIPHPNDPKNSELTEYFVAKLEERAQDPRDDLMSTLLAAEADGERLTRKEIISLCKGLLFAGNVTTTTLINHALYCFDKHPEVFDMLYQDPSLVPGAIEEVLRYQFSGGGMCRIARCDTTLCGQEIKEGQLVMAWLGAANFDETRFPHAKQFDIRRYPNQHMTFGHGIHFCLGAPLARLEGKIALTRIIERLTDIRCDPEHPLQYMSEEFDFVKSLPILFRAREIQLA